jgi:hypothetical protein
MLTGIPSFLFRRNPDKCQAAAGIWFLISSLIQHKIPCHHKAGNLHFAAVFFSAQRQAYTHFQTTGCSQHEEDKLMIVSRPILIQ